MLSQGVIYMIVMYSIEIAIFIYAYFFKLPCKN